MNNLEKAKRALSGKKKFIVRMEKTINWDYEVEAIDKNEANNLAWDQHNTGNNDGDEGNVEIYETEEIQS